MPQYVDKLRRGIARLERLLAEAYDQELAELYAAELAADQRMLADIERADRQAAKKS